MTLVFWLAGAAPWWGKNLVLLGDPTAPVFWNREGMETLWRDSQSMLKGGASLVDVVVVIPRLLQSHIIWFFPIAFLVLIAVMSQRRAMLPGAAVAFGLIAWPATGALPRFFVPTAWLLLALAASVSRRRLRRITVNGVLLWCIFVGGVVTATAIGRILTWEHVFLDTYAASSELSVNDPLHGFQAAHQLPGEAQVLFIAEPRGFLFPRRFVAPSQHDPNPLRELLEESSNLEEVVDQLEASGITHLLVNWNELARLNGSYPVAPWTTIRGRERWSELLKELGQPVVKANGIEVFELPR